MILSRHSPVRLTGADEADRGSAGRLGAMGLSCSIVSFVLTCTVALLGPSLMEPALPGGAGQPPWSIGAHPSPDLAVALSAAGIIAAVTGLTFSMNAINRGWSLPARPVLIAGIAGAVLLAILPPFGSSDHLGYAAYGRMAITGHNPFTTTPAQLARLGDPVARAVEDWRRSPSVYGPLGVAGQAFAAWVGGTSVRLIVFVLSLLNVLAFALTGLVLHWLGRGEEMAQRRAAILWTANPLVLLILVAGAHIDTQAIMFAIAAVAVAVTGLRAGRQRANLGNLTQALVGAGAGALVGLGFAIKVTTALVWAGIGLGIVLGWRWIRGSNPENGGEMRNPPRAGLAGLAGLEGLAGLAGGFGAVAGLALIPWGTGTFGPALRAGSLTSVGSPWRAVRSGLRLLIGQGAAENVVKVGALLLGAGLLVLLINYFRQADAAGRAKGALVAASAFAVVFAWLLAWPYVLPWYDGLGWALLVLLPASRLDLLMLARTTGLAIGYLPARGLPLAGGLGWLETVVRTAITPVVLLTVMVLAVVWLWRARRPTLVTL